MPKPRSSDRFADQIVLSDSTVVRIADEVERRILQLFRPEPTVAPDNSPRQIDPVDLLTPQQAAHLICKSDQTVYRCLAVVDICVGRAEITFSTRRQHEGE